MLWQQFKVQCRIVHALMIREIVAMYGRRGLGVLWLALEPLVFAIPVLLLWSAVRAPLEHGLPIMALLWTGYMPVLLFRHLVGHTLFLIRRNYSLMFHRNITVFDLFIARGIVDVAQNIMSAVILFLLFYVAGAIELPRVPPLLVAGYLLQIWWCMALGLLLGILSERAEWIEKAWSPISYTYMFWSGFGFLVEWLPSQWQNVALLLPPVQAYEILREGMLGDAIQTHYDIRYVVFSLALLTFAGLAIGRNGRRYIRAV